MSEKQYETDLEKPVSEVTLDEYFVVIGTETNLPELAYLPKKTFLLKTENHHDLKSEFDENNGVGEWGHGFFYVTKNNIVYSFFSFGPAGNASNIIGNLSTCDYPITEVTYLYRLRISEENANKIRKDVQEIRRNSNSYFYNEETKQYEENVSKNKKYRALTNATCAKEAEKILKRHLGKKIPDGKGYVKYGVLSIPAVNPYSWWEKLEKSSLDKFKYPEYPKTGKAEEKLAQILKNDSPNFVHRLYGPNLTNFYDEQIILWKDGDDAAKSEYWFLQEGDEDPLIEWEYINEI